MTFSLLGSHVAATVDALTDALRSLLKDREQLRVMGERGRALVRARYSWEAIADEFVATYEEGISRFRSTHGSILRRNVLRNADFG